MVQPSSHIFLVGMAVLVVVLCVGLRVKIEWSCRLRNVTIVMFGDVGVGMICSVYVVECW